MPLNPPERPPTLAALVARKLEALITSGEWKVGRRIPTEVELMERLQVSRNTLREAIRSLVHVGLLESRVGDGTYVHAFSELEGPLIRRARRAGAADAVEFRAVLERAAARFAAGRRTSGDIAKLRELLQRQLQAGLAVDRAAYAEADHELHRAVVSCSGNTLLAEVYDHLGGALKLAVSPELWDRALALREINLHAALVEAIEAGDPVAAERAADRLVDALQSGIFPSDELAEPARLAKGNRQVRSR
jgi:DNA-binding FadR family transcriptional regulator